MEDRAKIYREFWVAHGALSQTLQALKEAVRQCAPRPLKKGLTPKRPGMAKVIVFQDNFIEFTDSQEDS